jgi:hypothetical protein
LQAKTRRAAVEALLLVDNSESQGYDFASLGGLGVSIKQ